MSLNIEIRPCAGDSDYTKAEAVTRAYIDWLGVDLGYQDVDSEMADFAGMYGPPDGMYLLAFCGDDVAGGVGLRLFEPSVCEMKRLYVYPEFAGRGIGLALCETLITQARIHGYHAMRLDTLGHMQAAQSLYKRLGFVEIPAYRYNPDPETRFLELNLQAESEAATGG